jgi:MoaA/NifB/PqqE/SkfB family radical SAM enzyme
MNNFLPSRTYFPFLAHMVVTRNCNLSCAYCNEYKKAALPLPLPRLKRQIDRLRELGTLMLTLSGGEPLLHPEVYEILHYARGKFLATSIITNAYLLNDEAIDKLNAAGLTSAQISIDGVMPNKVTVKALSPLRSKLDTVARKARFMVNINSVIGPTPLAELVEIFEYARRNGFSTTAQVVHDSKGQLLPVEEDLRAYSGLAKKFLNPIWNPTWGQTLQLIARGSAPFKCRAGCRYLYINEFGQVCWCSATQNRYIKPLEDYTPQDLKTQFYLEKGCEEHCTLGCSRTCSYLEGFRHYGARQASLTSERNLPVPSQAYENTGGQRKK